MADWTTLLQEFDSQPEPEKANWLQDRMKGVLDSISAMRGGKNVLFYSSAFLQKPAVPPHLTQLTHEELNGFMSCLFGMNCDKGLTLLLHTPGGVTNAAETIVQYLHSKFNEIEAVIPAFAMSAGTMIALSADRVIMGRQSQLGPIDPQMPINGKFVSARAIVDQFNKAKVEVLGTQLLAHVWAPILQSLGPALLVEAQNALDYGERMVAEWLASRMFKSLADPATSAMATAAHFNDATSHKSHGRRINRDEARSQGVVIEELETSQGFQDAVYLRPIILQQFSTSKRLVPNSFGAIMAKSGRKTRRSK